MYYAIAALGAVFIVNLLEWRGKKLVENRQWSRVCEIIRLVGLVIAILAFCIISAQTLIQRHAIRAKGQALENDIRLPIGLWLRDNTPPNSSVALEPIGYIGYYSERYIIDFVGLVSPQVLPLRQEDPNHPLANIVLRLKPDYCVLRDAEYEANFASVPTYERLFVDTYKPVYSKDIYTVYQRIDGE